MPYSSVEEMKSKIKSTKNLSDSQAKKALKIINSLLAEDYKESDAIKIAISQVKKTVSNVNEINKQTYQDMRDQLAKDFDTYLRENKISWGWIFDHDNNYVFYDDDSTTYRLQYEIKNDKFIFIGNPEEVIKDTTYRLPKQELEIQEEVVGRSPKFRQAYGEKQARKTTHPTLKQFQEEEQIAIEPMGVGPEEWDLDDEAFDLPTIEYMVESFNKALDDGRMEFHYPHGVPVDWFEVEKAWVNPVECYIGETFVPEGQPICKVHYIDKEKWEARKNGEILGLSIGAQCTGYRKA